MELGVFLPISGRATGPETLIEAAQSAEALGFAAIWSADRVVTPWEITTAYPYSENRHFIVPPDKPFLDSLTCLAFLAGHTHHIRLGISVLVLPYRHPLYWARVAASIDCLSHGRLIMGVGVGWMREEFAALGVPFNERGRMTDEQLELVRQLWTKEHINFEGSYYQVRDIAFFPKPMQGVPLWVGGEGIHAQRRAARFGDAWFPYFVRITPEKLQAGFATVQHLSAEAGRDPAHICFACCRPIEVTSQAVPQDPEVLRGSPEQLVEMLRMYRDIGVAHLALQFMAPRWPERKVQIERFAREVLPYLHI
ncbi:luciferase-type oxidoreductase [Thermosporothrix hazakensis]|jgi:probable F420-dependent oxidoreductase|uniref:Luciferase-type oxidoreductase n=2 Tax=Thermosporothrix TaxID=768650 RepID=A0A326U9R9_THEHA|nr:LLM class F420-dependent oxidoreductase [Thermosporothrix hazakensis]PZW32831.1 luciferase-type oxidoreductase [Thermosporothrix hazakensis]BBH90812.1 LLM class F420-dependent oxidoreductase [Thermosporothrix sp. COM3]GCE48862.1 LLM class F420-dependent oxidoreductase [Thermosporothrix hazakensis]